MLSRDFAGSLAAVAEAEAWISGQSGALGLSAPTEFAINLCVEEAFVNAISHGGASQATITVASEPGGVRVEFADDGKPFDPTTAPGKRIEGPEAEISIGGYGLGLVKKFARRIDYRRLGNRNLLTLVFDAGPAQAVGAR